MVVVIIGVLVGIGYVGYFKSVDKSLQKTTVANLFLIKYSQEIYLAQKETYYPKTGTVDLAAINSNLRLAITSNDVVYVCSSGYTCTGTYAAKNWSYSVTPSTKPTCTGSGCL